MTGPPDPLSVTGIRLLPEFDALLCAYDPALRTRFVTAEHHERLWNRSNGMSVAPMLVDGRITGHWRLAGTGRTRELSVTYFSGTARPTKAALRRPAETLAGILGVRLSGISINRG